MFKSKAPVIAVHGGAGVVERAHMTGRAEAEYRAGITAALRAGHDILIDGGSSLDAVVAAVSVLEDDPHFNAGRGAAFTAEATNELDAAVMDGATLRAGAVTLITTVRNPVQLARVVMEKTPHVMLAGAGAEALARQHGLRIESPAYFQTERRRRALDRIRKASGAPHTEADKHGTVGAVALDAQGNLAAATSTGGRNNKLAGRVGDTPLVGAGTYANNASVAVSGTGDGEYFIRTVAAYSVAAAVEFKGMSVEEAARWVLEERLVPLGGSGGFIALDREGRVAMPFSTPGMYRGVIRDGQTHVAIFGE